MSALLRERDEHAKDGIPHPRTAVLHIDEMPYVNTAAKFWPTLIDEVIETYPAATAFELIAPASFALQRRFLDPLSALAESLRRLKDVDARKAIVDALAELELLGGPAPVIMRILAGDRELMRRDLPMDCIDADILPCLVAWLLEWAHIPDARWNAEFVCGAFMAEDRLRGRTYRIDFGLRRELLSEELHRWLLCVMPVVETLRATER